MEPPLPENGRRDTVAVLRWLGEEVRAGRVPVALPAGAEALVCAAIEEGNVVMTALEELIGDSAGAEAAVLARRLEAVAGGRPVQMPVLVRNEGRRAGWQCVGLGVFGGLYLLMVFLYASGKRS
jgi:hypothetical protein